MVPLTIGGIIRISRCADAQIALNHACWQLLWASSGRYHQNGGDYVGHTFADSRLICAQNRIAARSDTGLLP